LFQRQNRNGINSFCRTGTAINYILSPQGLIHYDDTAPQISFKKLRLFVPVEFIDHGSVVGAG
jgi:hypothetical protein